MSGSHSQSPGVPGGLSEELGAPLDSIKVLLLPCATPLLLAQPHQLWRFQYEAASPNNYRERAQKLLYGRKRRKTKSLGVMGTSFLKKSHFRFPLAEAIQLEKASFCPGVSSFLTQRIGAQSSPNLEGPCPRTHSPGSPVLFLIHLPTPAQDSMA